MKKFIALLLVCVLVLSVAACAKKEPAPAEAPAAEEPAPAAEKVVYDAANIDACVDAAVKATTGKIAIITNTVSQNEEEYRSAQYLVTRYGADRVIHDTMPDNFMAEQEQYISVVNKYGADPDVKVIIINQACPGADPAIDKVLESRSRDDLLIVFCTPQEDPADITTRADIVISIDEIGKGKYMAEQAHAMGCKTFVHYSFPRHMAQVQLASCRDLIREGCESSGIEFVDATAPDPTGDAGASGAQMFILEDVPKMVEKYGQETAFFSTNCSMQVPLIKAVFDAGAYYVQPCCPSPYHGFPGALGIEQPEDLVNGLAATIEKEKEVIAAAGLSGHFSTWAVPASIANTVATAQYGFLWMAGAVESKHDMKIITDLLNNYAGTSDTAVYNYTDTATGVTYENYFLYQLGYLTF